MTHCTWILINCLPLIVERLTASTDLLLGVDIGVVWPTQDSEWTGHDASTDRWGGGTAGEDGR